MSCVCICSGIIHVWVSMRPSIVLTNRVRARESKSERVWKSNKNVSVLQLRVSIAVHVNPIDSNFDIIEWNIGSKPKWIFFILDIKKLTLQFVTLLITSIDCTCHLVIYSSFFFLLFLHSEEWTDIIIRHKSNLIS